MTVKRIALLGLGTVGSAVYELNRPFGETQFQFDRALVRHPDAYRPSPLALTDSWEKILDDPMIDVVVEVTGSRDMARSGILRALEQGKAVVTANKEVMALYGPELVEAAGRHQTFLGYEAAVAGGIPILDALSYHLSVAPIHTIYGVINGTTNYLLEKMSLGHSLKESIQEAQTHGYAEAQPDADLSGRDAAYKLIILAYLAFGQWLDLATLDISGVEDWPPALFSRLRKKGLTVRLVAIAQMRPQGRLAARVAPMLVPLTHPLGQLQGADNAIGCLTDAGHFWLQGPGAGGIATATSIWADIRRSLNGPRVKPDAPFDRMSADFFDQPVARIPLDPDRDVTEGDDEGLLAFYQLPSYL